MLSFSLQFISIEIKSMLDFLITPTSLDISDIINYRYKMYLPLFFEFMEIVYSSDIEEILEKDTANSIIRCFKEMLDIIIMFFEGMLEYKELPKKKENFYIYSSLIRFLGFGMKESFEYCSERTLPILDILLKIENPNNDVLNDPIIYLVPGLMNYVHFMIIVG